ncbi:hypothetical protein GCK32_011655, partial [Trichostrongylus colubriformis]
RSRLFYIGFKPRDYGSTGYHSFYPLALQHITHRTPDTNSYVGALHTPRKMFQKLLICLTVVIALISFTSADFSCFFGDTICKSITCRGCTVATCLNGDCVCTLCN